MPKVTRISDRRPTLEEAQTLVGGYVQLIGLSGGRQMLVDEDGLLKRLPTNPEATAEVVGEGVLVDVQRGIVGDVVILSGAARWV